MALPLSIIFLGLILLLVPIRRSDREGHTQSLQATSPNARASRSLDSTPKLLTIFTDHDVTAADEEDSFHIDPNEQPTRLSELHAVMVAYADDIAQASSCLKDGLSVLVRCDRILARHLAHAIIKQSGRPSWWLHPAAIGSAGNSGSEPAGNRRVQLMNALRNRIAAAPGEEILVISQPELLANVTQAATHDNEDEFADLVYGEGSDRIFLAFADPNAATSEALTDRFAARLTIVDLPRTIRAEDGTEVPLGRVLVTKDEAGLFEGFDPFIFHRHVVGMNAVQLRHALRFAFLRYSANTTKHQPTFADLLVELRTYGARAVTMSEAPDISFQDIGGYEEIKAEFYDALQLMASGLPPSVTRGLLPKGFILHGPPGTGKTLFAKAIASQLDAAVIIASGPELLSKHIGETERHLEKLFTEARAHAPTIMVLDEIDAIASRGPRYESDISHENSAIVSRLLVELDRLRPEVPVLVIGTTNRIDILDSRLFRPQYLRAVKIDLPNEQDRRVIVQVQANYFTVAVDDDLVDSLAQATEGMTGDEIRSIFQTAYTDQLIRGRPADATRLRELVRLLKSKKHRNN
jgi:transitional endoplasmic reticulum ATPase